MFTQVSKYRLSSAAIFVLTAFLFWFTYSELGQIAVAKENPAQDYCEIVKVTKAETGKISVRNLYKLKVEKSACKHCIDDISAHIFSYSNSNIEQFHSSQKTTQIYLFNEAFLI